MKNLGRLVAFAAAALACGAIHAQTYPSRAVKLVVPFPAGGPSDIFARMVAHGMTGNLGQPVFIENKGGAGGVIGVDYVAKSAPDGYTIALNNLSSLAISPFSLSAMPYDPNKDLALITGVVRVPEVLVVIPSLPVNNLAELVAYAKAHPGKVNFGSAGTGSITHLAGELLKVEAKIDIVHVPYKGAAPVVNDLLGGVVQMAILDVPVLLPHIKSGKLRAIVLTSAKRAPSLPGVPTTVEAGYPKVISDNWYGLVAPAKTPADTLKRLHDAAIAALGAPELLEQFAKLSGVAIPSTPREYAAYVAGEQAKWGAIVKAIGFKE